MRNDEITDASWVFLDPPNQATITTTFIMDGDRFVDFVSHDEDDGGWQFLSRASGTPKIENALVVGLQEVVITDHRLLELADLPIGWCAWRDKIGDPWCRASTSELPD